MKRTKTQQTPLGRAKIATICIQRMALADLKPHPRNEAIRRHPEPGTPRWDALKASLADSYFDPVVLNKRNGLLVSGHLRLKVMLSEGYTHADVSVVDYTEEKHLARMLAANQGMGEDIMAGVKDLIEELDAANLDLNLTGFALPEIEDMMTAEPPAETEDESGDSKHRCVTCPKCGAKFAVDNRA